MACSHSFGQSLPGTVLWRERCSVALWGWRCQLAGEARAGGRWGIRSCYCLMSGLSWCSEDSRLLSQVLIMRVQFAADLCGWVSLEKMILAQDRAKWFCFPKDDEKIKHVMTKKYFAAQNLEAVASVELQLKFCPTCSLTIKEQVTRTLLLMTARTIGSQYLLLIVWWLQNCL